MYIYKLLVIKTLSLFYYFFLGIFNESLKLHQIKHVQVTKFRLHHFLDQMQTTNSANVHLLFYYWKTISLFLMNFLTIANMETMNLETVSNHELSLT